MGIFQQHHIKSFVVVKFNINKIIIYEPHFLVFLVVSIGFVLRSICDPEVDEVAVIELNITNPLSTDFTVTVNSVDGTATGE